MFDRVIADFRCPYCGFRLTKSEMEKTLNNRDSTWQTKSAIKLLKIYKVGDKPIFSNVKVDSGWMEIHHVCPKCDKFIQAEIQIRNGKLRKKVRYVKNTQH